MKSKNPTPEFQNLIDLQIKAKNDKAGKWNSNPKVLKLCNTNIF